MASNNSKPSEYASMTGAKESAEPTSTNTHKPTTPAKRSPSQHRQTSTSSTSTTSYPTTGSTAPSSNSTPASTIIPPLRKQPSSTLLPSAGSSPQTSRNTSPVRRDSSRPPGSLSNQVSTQPSAAAIQRALSAANVPQLSSNPVADAVSRLPRAPKSAGGASGDSTPQLPSSPRVKSPPPSAVTSRRGSAVPVPAQQKKGAEITAAGSVGGAKTAPSINVQNATPTPPGTLAIPKNASEDTKKVDSVLAQLQASSNKPPSRGPSGKSVLETVQESSADAVGESPAALQAAADLKPLTRISEDDKADGTKRGGNDAANDTGRSQQQRNSAESGSESAGTKGESKRGRRQSLTQSNVTSTPNSTLQSRPKSAVKGGFAPLTSAKSRQQAAEGKPGGMTVETETVASIPQSALNAGDYRTSNGRSTEAGGSVRLKPSNETIRPKKERRKPNQKTRSMGQGTGMYFQSKNPLLGILTWAPSIIQSRHL